MFSFFRQLHAVEYRGALLTIAEHFELRQREASPIWSRMQAWLERGDVKRVLPKSDIRQAIGYLRHDVIRLRSRGDVYHMHADWLDRQFSRHRIPGAALRFAPG